MMFKTVEIVPPWIPPAESMTPSANKALSLAESEAKRLKHGYIGAEHLLLSIVAMDEDAACASLKSQGLTLEKLKKDAKYQTGNGGGATERKPMTFTPTMKKIITIGIAKAQSLGEQLTGPEHLLDAILEEGQNSAILILQDMKINTGRVRKEMLK